MVSNCRYKRHLERREYDAQRGDLWLIKEMIVVIMATSVLSQSPVGLERV